MADRYSSSAQLQRQPYRGGGGRGTFLTRIFDAAPNSTQLVGLMTLFISGGILLVLTGLTITATILGLIFFAPLILLSSPIWVPVGAVLFVVVAGFLTMCGSGMAVVAGLSWVYRYFKGMNPPGSGGLDYARDRVKDYAREFQSRAKDAAPGA